MIRFGNRATSIRATVGVETASSLPFRRCRCHIGLHRQPSPGGVRYHSVRHTLSDLRALMNRMEADTGFWKQQGMQWSWSGCNVTSNKVDIQLTHSTKAYRDALIARYGSDWVTVDPRDVEYEG
jgi:hypothetical protein